MAALDFPNSPTIGDTFTDSGITWIWTGVTWDIVHLTDTINNNVLYTWTNTSTFTQGQKFIWQSPHGDWRTYIVRNGQTLTAGQTPFTNPEKIERIDNRPLNLASRSGRAVTSYMRGTWLPDKRYATVVRGGNPALYIMSRGFPGEIPVVGMPAQPGVVKSYYNIGTSITLSNFTGTPITDMDVEYISSLNEVWVSCYSSTTNKNQIARIDLTTNTLIGYLTLVETSFTDNGIRWIKDIPGKNTALYAVWDTSIIPNPQYEVYKLDLTTFTSTLFGTYNTNGSMPISKWEYIVSTNTVLMIPWYLDYQARDFDTTSVQVNFRSVFPTLDRSNFRLGHSFSKYISDLDYIVQTGSGAAGITIYKWNNGSPQVVYCLNSNNNYFHLNTRYGINICEYIKPLNSILFYTRAGSVSGSANVLNRQFMLLNLNTGKTTVQDLPTPSVATTLPFAAENPFFDDETNEVILPYAINTNEAVFLHYEV